MHFGRVVAQNAILSRRFRFGSTYQDFHGHGYPNRRQLAGNLQRHFQFFVIYLRNSFFFVEQGMTSLPDFVQFKMFPASPLRLTFSAAPDDLLQLLTRFLALNPAERCTCTEALQSPYFRYGQCIFCESIFLIHYRHIVLIKRLAKKVFPCSIKSVFINFSNKPAPSPGQFLPLPMSVTQAAMDKNATKRKVTEVGDGASLAKRLVF